MAPYKYIKKFNLFTPNNAVSSRVMPIVKLLDYTPISLP